MEGSWFNTLTMGWVYLYPSSTENGFWIWTKELGWFFSNQERFPEGYLQSINSWILLDQRMFEIRYLESESSTWRSFPKDEFEFFSLDGEIPEELQGLRYRSTGGNTQHTIVFGRFVFIEERCDPNGCRKLVYLFNALDGHFYTESMPEALHRYKVEVDGDRFSITQEPRLFDFPATVETYEIGWN